MTGWGNRDDRGGFTRIRHGAMAYSRTYGWINFFRIDFSIFISNYVSLITRICCIQNDLGYGNIIINESMMLRRIV